jgi:hypothetical protein
MVQSWPRCARPCIQAPEPKKKRHIHSHKRKSQRKVLLSVVLPAHRGRGKPRKRAAGRPKFHPRSRLRYRGVVLSVAGCRSYTNQEKEPIGKTKFLKQSCFTKTE